jgi:hypothetical protein
MRMFSGVLCTCRCDDNMHGYGRIVQNMHSWKLLCRGCRGAHGVLVCVGVLFACRGSQLVLWNGGLVYSMCCGQRVRWRHCCADLMQL